MKNMPITRQFTLVLAVSSLAIAALTAFVSDRHAVAEQIAATHQLLRSTSEHAAQTAELRIAKAASRFERVSDDQTTPPPLSTPSESGTSPFEWITRAQNGPAAFPSTFSAGNDRTEPLISEARQRLSHTDNTSIAFFSNDTQQIIFARTMSGNADMLVAALSIETLLERPDKSQLINNLMILPGGDVAASTHGAGAEFAIGSAAAALAGADTRSKQLSAPNGEPVLVASTAISLAGETFVFASQEPLQQALKEAQDLRIANAIQILISVAVISLLGWALSHLVMRPLMAVSDAVQNLGQGNLSAEIPGLHRNDAVGKIAKGVEQLKQVWHDQKQAESAASTRNRALAETSAAISLLDPDNRIVDINPALIIHLSANPALFGLENSEISAEALRGRPIFDLLENAPDVETLLSNRSALPRSIDLVLGDERYGLRAAELFDAEGTPTGTLLEWRNIGAERLNAGLVSAIQKYKATVEFDMDGNVLSANENFLAVMGYSAGELHGMHHSAFLPVEDRETADYKTHWERLARGEQVAGKFLRLSKTGRQIWLDAAYNPIADQNGHVYKVIKFASDVTEIETLAHDRKAVIDAISRAQSVIEIDTDRNVASANDNLLLLLDRAHEDVIGSNVSDLFDPGFRASQGFQDMWATLENGSADAQIYELQNRDGEKCYLQGSITPVFDQKGCIYKYIGCLADVTVSETNRLIQQEQNAKMADQQEQVVNHMRRGLTALAEGDLSMELTTPFGGEYETLRLDFNRATKRLHDTVSIVINNTDGIRNEASEIVRAADDLSRRTESQAATLEQTSASLEQLTASVKSAAQGAEKADLNVTEAKTNAEQSGAVVDEAITAMSEIEASSRQISQIIGVIDDIAFQTNLLALNAGVEAARAGEAGRGFAVVASEVRALAQRSSEAAKEIKDLISTSSQQVGSGVELVGKTGQALKEILGSVTSISDLVGDIANTAREQSVGIGEINTAVNQIDQVTQQNAAMVEESTAASHSLMQEAEQLAQLVAQFHVAGKPATPAEPQAPTAAMPQAGPAPLPIQGNTALEPEDDDDWREF